MEELEMLEFEKDGPKFSFSNKQTQPTLSKVDKFITDASWFECLSGFLQVSLGFQNSDNKIIQLKS